ncbi:MAG: hypothetical protein EPN30_08735 [Actinomycetota bacterium]|nr:MAG: hypothetical protein EPN30_08735 [Actinomycetota bacterium]
MPSQEPSNSRANSTKHAAQNPRSGWKIGVAIAAILIILAAAIGFAESNGAKKTSASPPGSKSSTTAASSTTSGRVTSATKSSSVTPKAWIASLEAKVKGQAGHLQPGSDPSVLPGPIMIADRNNSRILIVDPKGRIIWQFPTAGDLTQGQTFVEPDDAFFGPKGYHILATQEDQFVLTEISAQGGHITFRYGHPGTSGSAAGYLDNPDDAMILPNGNMISADIKNCRLLYLSPSSLEPVHIYGETTTYCYHQPPLRFGSPNGMFPMANGDWLVTEINGDWVDEMTPDGQIKFSVHPPGITYPSDSNEVSPGTFLTAAYTKPGVIEEFNQSGTLTWRFAPTGTQALNQPSIAIPLPNGDILATDDWNHRVIVVDPKTNKIVWQYGHTGVSGTQPGYLNKPDGVDLAPPYSLMMTHAATVGIPPFQPSSAATPTTGG